MRVDIFNTDKQYDIIYADPPWRFNVWSRETGLERSADKHYQTMQKKDIEDLPVSRIGKKNSVLLMWATFPCLEQALELIKKWGYTYKTCAFTWIKKNKRSNTDFVGMGYYTRANAEICLLASRGKPLKRESRSVRQVIQSVIEEHSKKPAEVRDRIAQLFGGGCEKIELFARQYADSWDCWGNEV